MHFDRSATFKTLHGKKSNNYVVNLQDVETQLFFILYKSM